VLVLRVQVLAAFAVVGALALGGVLVFAGPTARTSALPLPPDHGLPYTRAAYSVSEVRAAFAAGGVPLAVRARSAAATTLGSRGDVLEVDTFADAGTVGRTGFWDYTVVDGRYVHFPRACGTAVPDAERWQGNVRVVLSCARAGSAARAWLRRVDRALARLGA
jgi:hypothetical protein